MKYVLAPLADYTNAAFRRLCHGFGADLTYTEMVSAAALAHGSSPTRHLLELLPGEGPVACQLFGHNPDELAFAAREVTALRRFVSIDLNAGCPMPRIVQGGDGAAMIRNPQLIHDCLNAIRSETDLPVTLKTRIGPSPDKVMMLELLDVAESTGCAGITVHGRFTSQKHGGPVHLDLIAELVRHARIPVTGNGGISDLPSAELMAQTGVAAIMIGRAALANPWLFGDLKTDSEPPSGDVLVRRQNAVFQDHVANLIELHAQLSRNFPDDHVPALGDYLLGFVRTHLFHYFKGRPGVGEFRRRLNEIRTLAELQSAAAPFLAQQMPIIRLPQDRRGGAEESRDCG